VQSLIATYHEDNTLKCPNCDAECYLNYVGVDSADQYAPTREWACTVCPWREGDPPRGFDLNCQGCGVTGVELFDTDCQPTDRNADWRRVTVCMGCVERLDVDLWISEQCWSRINAVVPFADLPVIDFDKAD
jgi:phage-related protein